MKSAEDGISVLFDTSSGTVRFSSPNGETANFDEEGRLLDYRTFDVLYKRSVSNHVLKIESSGDRTIVEELTADQSWRIIENGYSMARKASLDGMSAETRARAELVNSRERNWIEADSRKMSSQNSSMPIVPPDQANVLYLELTAGCKWNRCTLCSGYGDIQFSVKDEDQFHEHMHSVKEAYGKGISSRKWVFLGDPHAIDIDQATLIRLLDNIREEFDLPVFGMFDIFTTPKKKNMISYRDLKEHGLAKMYVFLESGSYKVIRLFNRHINVTETMNILNNIKDHGISIGIMTLSGIGGKRFSQDHVDSTANIISQLALDGNDTISISPIMEGDDPNYAGISSGEDLHDLSPEEKRAQMDELIASIRESFRDVNGRELDADLSKTDLKGSML